MNANALLKRFLAAALVAGLMLAATVVSAQPASNPTAPKKSPYRLEIEGGFLLSPTGNKVEASLENVVERLRELELQRNGDPANIVLSPDLPKIKIANLKLSATTLTQQLEALRVASGERFSWSTGESPYAMVDPATGLAVSLPPDQMPLPLYILRPAPESGRGRLRVEAFSLAGYFESRGIRLGDSEKEYRQMIEEEFSRLREIMRETVQIYRNLIGEGTAFRGDHTVQFHSGANLIVVMGEPEAVEIAAKVIGALPHVQRSGGDVTDGYGGGGMGIPGRMPTHSELFKNRYGIGILPQPGVGAPGAPPVPR